MRGVRGHTLLEIFLVVGILAVLAGSNVPRLRWLATSAGFQSDVSQLTGFLMEAQKRALLGHKRFSIKIDTAQNNFSLYSMSDGGGVSSTLLADASIKLLKIDDNVRIEASVSQLIFYPDGHVTPAHVRLFTKEHSAVLSSQDQWGKIAILYDEGADGHDHPF